MLAVLGSMMIAFVAVTRGEHGAWMLWIAIPLMMISLGYLFVVNAIPVFLGPATDRQSEKEQNNKTHQE